jgi:hypothetical protein
MNKILIIGVISIAMLAFTADGRDDYKRNMRMVIDKYLHAKKLKMTITATIFIPDEGGLKQQETKTKIFADNDQYRYETGYLKFIMNKHCMIYIDEGNKFIFYKKLDKAVSMKEYAQINSLPGWFATLDSGLSYCSNIKRTSSSQGSVFTGTISKGQYSQFSVTILNDTTISAFCYDVRKGQNEEFSKYCVKFSETNFDPVFDKSFFDESPFIKVSTNAVKLAPRYQSFTLKLL